MKVKNYPLTYIYIYIFENLSYSKKLSIYTKFETDKKKNIYQNYSRMMDSVQTEKYSTINT